MLACTTARSCCQNRMLIMLFLTRYSKLVHKKCLFSIYCLIRLRTKTRPTKRWRMNKMSACLAAPASSPRRICECWVHGEKKKLFAFTRTCDEKTSLTLTRYLKEFDKISVRIKLAYRLLSWEGSRLTASAQRRGCHGVNKGEGVPLRFEVAGCACPGRDGEAQLLVEQVEKMSTDEKVCRQVKQCVSQYQG